MPRARAHLISKVSGIAPPDHVAGRGPIARIVGRKVAQAPPLDLIYLRVPQMDGCAYCLDMHWKDLRAEGETESRRRTSRMMCTRWRDDTSMRNSSPI